MHRMDPCSYVSRSGWRCARQALHNSRYCWRHTPGFLLVYLLAGLVLFIGVIGAWAMMPGA